MATLVSRTGFEHIRDWQRSLALAPARMRTKATATTQRLRPLSDDIDLAAGVLTVRNAKAGAARSVILTDEAKVFFEGAMAKAIVIWAPDKIENADDMPDDIKTALLCSLAGDEWVDGVLAFMEQGQAALAIGTDRRRGEMA